MPVNTIKVSLGNLFFDFEFPDGEVLDSSDLENDDDYRRQITVHNLDYSALTTENEIKALEDRLIEWDIIQAPDEDDCFWTEEFQKALVTMRKALNLLSDSSNSVYASRSWVFKGSSGPEDVTKGLTVVSGAETALSKSVDALEQHVYDIRRPILPRALGVQ